MQAQRLAVKLARFEPVAVVSSPYVRAVRRVEPAARRLALPVAVDMALRERDLGLGPGPDFAEHYARSWADPELARPGRESLTELSQRAVAALRALAAAHHGAAVLVGSQGMFIARAGRFRRRGGSAVQPGDADAGGLPAESGRPPGLGGGIGAVPRRAAQSRVLTCSPPAGRTAGRKTAIASTGRGRPRRKAAGGPAARMGRLQMWQSSW